ncbi:hypothetical protein EHV15_34415 [Paenibacillus oralis]|uniref:Uncharacterized protein n=1 Tax=Paenibacillus oralis TaxID=2490856 RepID=A0A3P3TAY7_9BACL|nr:hypothetical protein [Paenibacillus oralis]RRJ54694.1 hypothetical protein EHV15_34415 [Paenibacillus oralis]
MVKRIALITESQARQEVPTVAYEFYKSPKSRWVNAIMEYMETREFPRSDMFFVSLVNKRIYGYDEMISPYPKRVYHPRKQDSAMFAQDILKFIQSYGEPVFVELHMSQTLANELKSLFHTHGIDYKFYGEGQSLAAKPIYYQRLILEEMDVRKVRDIHREKWGLAAGIIKRSPTEAQRILDEYGHKQYLFKPEVETILESLKQVMKKHYERRKDEREAFDEFLQELAAEEGSQDFEAFFQNVNCIYELCAQSQKYEQLKTRFGRPMSKFERYLIKREYALEIENKISATLLKLQINLL